MKANIASLVALVFVLGIILIEAPHIDWTATKIVGAAVAAISLPLFVLARFQLGASFSVQAKAKKLVTTGLYSRIRNPVYLFGGLFLAGLSMFLSVWGPLVLAAVLVPLQITRARREAEVLEQAFGDDYRRYREKTWF